MFQKNQRFTAEITDLTSDGEGIGKVGAFPLFIKDACVGDVVEASVTKLKKTYGYGRLVQVIRPSKDRVEPVCPVARSCGGCQIQHTAYEAQLAFKTEKVRQDLIRIGGFTDPEVLPCIGMEEPWHYRNKAQVPFGKDREGRVIAGFYAGRTHSIIDQQECAITFQESAELLKKIRSWMEKTKAEPYDEETGSGLIRHALLRKGFKTGEIMVCLVVNGRKIPAKDQLIESLKQVPGFMTLALNINTKRTNKILGDETLTLYGPGVIRDRIGDILFEISPASFFQVNPVQTEVLYSKALEYASLTGNETVWDLYCGIGTISLFLSRKAKQVYGAEIVSEAIEDAKRNALVNGIENAEFYTGKAEEIFPEWVSSNPEHTADCIVVDPPRKGLEKTVIDAIIRVGPPRVVYVSCSPSTLARDLKLFSEGGFQLKKVQPVDMFPHTCGTEAVALLLREDANKERRE